MMRTILVFCVLLGISNSGLAQSLSANEQAAWIAASKSDDLSAYSEFIKNFPDGTFAPLARIKLSEAGLSLPILSLTDQDSWDKPYTQSRSIQPQSKPACLSDADAECVLYEITTLIAKEVEPASRVTFLCDLAQALAKAGDVAGGTKSLQQAASLARGLSGSDEQGLWKRSVDPMLC